MRMLVTARPREATPQAYGAPLALSSAHGKPTGHYIAGIELSHTLAHAFTQSPPTVADATV